MPDDLKRFLEAQEVRYGTALQELRSGAKKTHWMWFVLPQLRGLGHSQMARLYGIRDMAEARAYLAHPVLGNRMRECVAALLDHREAGAHTIFGSPDDLKFRSCLTLFEAASVSEPDKALFAEALEAFYPEGRDGRTLSLLDEG